MKGFVSSGRLVAVLGPSGAGKDTLMDAACRARPDLGRVTRVITRHPDAGGEEFISVSDMEFAEREATGEFLFSWRAHGLHYGVPASAMNDVRRGKTMLFNGSRAALASFRETIPDLGIILVTASPDVLAQRLLRRGREGREDVARRLTRAVEDNLADLRFFEVENSGSVAAATQRFLSALDEMSKVDGEVLSSSRDNPQLAHGFTSKETS